MNIAAKLLTACASFGRTRLAEARRLRSLKIGDESNPCIHGMAAKSGHESSSPHPSHRAHALASPHLVRGIGPRADWLGLKSETGLDSGLQAHTTSLPIPPVSLLGEQASGLSDDNRPALVAAEPWASSTRMIPHRCRSLSPSRPLQLTHPPQLPICDQGADRFSGKQFSCFELCSELTKNQARPLAGCRFVRLATLRVWPTRQKAGSRPRRAALMGRP
jgi:hypothetical protein